MSRVGRKRYRFKPRFFVIIGVLALIVVLFAACHHGGSGDGSKDGGSSDKKAKPAEEKVVSVNVTCAGDIIGHSPLVDACRTDDGYDFTPCFRYVKDIIQEADASICTFEGSMTEPPYSGYPLFRSPKDLAKSLKKVGFTSIDIASNHSADNGRSGFDSTIKTCKDAGLIVAGEQENEGDPKYAMVDTDKGVKVAFVHYTYNDGSVEQPTVNGIPLDESMQKRCNTFYMGDKEGSVKEIAGVCKAAREAGADIVVVGFHWGEEYQLTSNSDQQKLAQMVVDETDADIIFGSHPHVPQQYALLKSADGSREVHCYYALGNLLSNQRQENIGNSAVEEGVIVRFDIEYDKEKKEVKSIKTKDIPYWVDLYDNKYRIVPLKGDYQSNDTLKASGHLERAQAAEKSLYDILGKDKN